MRCPSISAFLPLALLASAMAQAGAFDAAVAKGLEDRESARLAVQAFLHTEPGRLRDDRLAVAARCAWAAGEHELCLRWSDEAELREPLPFGTVEARLRALLALQRASAFVRAAEFAMTRLPAVVDAVLRAEEARCVEVADGLMRDADIAAGLWLFDAIASLPPPDPARSCNLALALRHAGDLARSRLVYEQALALAPMDAWAWNDYGLLLRVSGEPAAASEAFRKSLGCDVRSGDGPGLTNLVLEAALGNQSASTRSGALELASAALAIRPEAALLRRATIDLVLKPHPRRRAQLEPDTASRRR